MDLIKIVLASPSDLNEERRFITNTIKNKDAYYKRNGITLDLRRWEDTTPGASKTGAQGIIDDDLDIRNSDVFICMYWEKIGTIIDGLNETGTEHELNLAVKSFEETGKPDIKFLLKKTEKRDPKISEIAEKLKPITLYKEFETIEDLNNIIDRIISEECNKHLHEEGKSETTSCMYGKTRIYKEVGTMEDFIDSLNCNNTAFFHPGFFDLLNNKTNEYAHYEDVFDGIELIIENLSNYTMIGNHTNLLVEPRYATAITFKNCDNIYLSGFVIGHTPHKAECVGSVLKFENCTNISLDNLELFGCGTYGIESYYSNFYINGCKINNCSQGALLFENSNAQIHNSEIYDCNNIDGDLISLLNSYLYLRNVCIHNNMISGNVFCLDNSNIYGEAVTVIHNRYSGLGILKDDCFVKDNIITNSYPATIDSTRNVTKNEYEALKEFLNEKASIYESVFEDGKIFIQFMANSIDIIDEVEEYCNISDSFSLACG